MIWSIFPVSGRLFYPQTLLQREVPMADTVLSSLCCWGNCVGSKQLFKNQKNLNWKNDQSSGWSNVNSPGLLPGVNNANTMLLACVFAGKQAKSHAKSGNHIAIVPGFRMLILTRGYSHLTTAWSDKIGNTFFQIESKPRIKHIIFFVVDEAGCK